MSIAIKPPLQDDLDADNDRFVKIEPLADRARSYAASLAEAAFRGRYLVERHLAKLNIVAEEAIKIGYLLGKPANVHRAEVGHVG
jgi:hypothetical protein